MATVSTNNVTKRYDNQQILHGVSIDIADGEFTVLVGPSGCGKSTLLRMIAGLEEVSSGDISIGRRRVNDLAPKERDIAMVFQSYALYPHMTVYDNMAFSLTLAKRAKSDIAAQVRKAAEILSLTPLLGRFPRQLSGGQRQRVAMGRAIVRNPQVFLFDEPLSNLDAKLRVQMRAEIKELHQRLKTTSVYVTHDQIEAMTLADKIVVMREGRVEQVGKPLELYDRPANLFVAGFIGSPSMNFIPGVFRNQGGRAGIEIADHNFVPLPMATPAHDGQQVILGVRPEHFLLAGLDQGIASKVVVVEPTGAEVQVLSKVGDADIVSVFRERHEFAPGSIVRLQPDLEKLHLFDAASGKALSNGGIAHPNS
jgi:multiple sugar transport system ATP-binding protein